MALTAITALGLSAGIASAAGTVQWNNPADGTVYQVGTHVTPDGTANGFGTGGTGLDLALVLDASGSMGTSATSGGVTKTRAEWQAEAAVALVNSLPANSTAVAVIEFGTVAGTSVVLPLTSTTQAADIVAAINGVTGTQGSTAIGTGIATARTELLANATAGASQQIVVISDGQNNSGVNPVTAAENANADGITVHGVSIPGGNTGQMEDIANAGGGTFFNASTDQGLQDLISLFSGFGGTLVGVDRVEVTLPDGTVIANALTDAFGNFDADWNIELGNNPFVATAFFSDGSTATANLNLVGVDNGTNPVPLPAAGWLLLSGIAGLGFARRARRTS
jgi:Mg-chelatase subunit ChlD